MRLACQDRPRFDVSHAYQLPWETLLYGPDTRTLPPQIVRKHDGRLDAQMKREARA